jgi:hypothetical protein
MTDPAGSAHPKRIVVCFDGTANQIGAGNLTNVAKLFSMLIKSDPNSQLQARSQAQPVNRVDQPLPRFIAKTRQSKPFLDKASRYKRQPRHRLPFWPPDVLGGGDRRAKPHEDNGWIKAAEEERYDNPRNGQ